MESGKSEVPLGGIRFPYLCYALHKCFILNIAEISKGKQKCKQNSLIVIKIDKSIVKKNSEKQL